MIELTDWEKEIRDAFIVENAWGWVRASLTVSFPGPSESAEHSNLIKAGFFEQQKKVSLAIAHVTASFNDHPTHQAAFIRCLEE